jgi:hypothetical protein
MIPSATALMSEPSRDSPSARALSKNSREGLEEEGAKEDDEEKGKTHIYGCLLYPPVINPSSPPALFIFLLSFDYLSFFIFSQVSLPFPSIFL